MTTTPDNLYYAGDKVSLYQPHEDEAHVYVVAEAIWSVVMGQWVYLFNDVDDLFIAPEDDLISICVCGGATVPVTIRDSWLPDGDLIQCVKCNEVY